MEEDKLPCTLDQEVFERVWRRVMPETRTDSPIALLDPVPAPLPPAVPALSPKPRHTDYDVPCLGAASAVYGGLLQQYIDRELTAARLYYALAQRTAGRGGRVLSVMAADQHRHAKRLSTAYFLISGVRYWPAQQRNQPLAGSLPAILRQCFGDEQRAEAAYLAAAESTRDATLRELYLELAGDEGSHVRLLQDILDQL